MRWQPCRPSWSAGTRSNLLQQLLSVTKATGTYSHIFNAGTDNDALEAARAAHEAGTGPAVGTVLVAPNGAQLQEVRAGGGQVAWLCGCVAVWTHGCMLGRLS